MPDLQKHDSVVAFCIDRNFLPLTLFMIWQISHLNPQRRFDFLISSQDDLEIPDWAKPYGIVLHRSGSLPAFAEAARYAGSMSTVLRLMLARELGDRYRRIIYLDSDMYVAGGNLGRLMDIDLGPHPIGAVLDCPFFIRAEAHAEDYRAAGLPLLPYFNAGFQVIDTRAYQDQEVERRAFDVCRTHKSKISYGDQTLTNLALKGRFAQLSPCWNWQMDSVHPYLAHLFPVYHHHFISAIKPNLVSNGLFPVRFNQAYRDFFTQYAPEALAELAPPPKPQPLSFKEQARMLFDDLQVAKIASAMFARYPDPYRAVL